jgi:hypothetical protein
MVQYKYTSFMRTPACATVPAQQKGGARDNSTLKESFTLAMALVLQSKQKVV